MSTQTNKSQIESLLARAKELKEKNEPKTELIPTVQVEEPVVSLPQVFKPVAGLSLTDSNEVETKDTLMSKLAINVDDYKTLALTEDAQTRVKKSIGRLTHGASASVPILCKGNDCTYAPRCVAGTTEILVDGLKTKQIKYITVGDYVYSINQETLLLEKKKVLDVYINAPKPIYRVTTGLGLQVLVTDNHPFAVYENDTLIWRTIDDGLDFFSKILIIDTLDSSYNNIETVGDCIVDEVLDIEYLYDEVVYDIEVEDNHNFIGNGIVLHNCPFVQEGQTPLNKPCLVEVTLAEYWTQKYMEDLQINPNSISEVHALSNLVEISIQENRVNMYMSIQDQDMLADVVTGYDEEGNAITNKDVSKAFEIRERLDKRKLKTLESLSATRSKRIELQAKLQGNQEQTNNIKNLKETMEDLIRAVKDQKVVVNG